MAFKHARHTRVLMAEIDLTSYLRDSSASQTGSPDETTTYGKDTQTFIVGLGGGTLRMSGLFDANPDHVLHGSWDDAFQSANGEPVTWAPEGLAHGARLRTALVRETSYGVSAPVGGVVSASADFQCDGGLESGVSLHDLTAETASANGTTFDGAAASSDGGVAVIHCTAASGTSPTLDAKVQHSTDGNTWADLATFIQLTAAGSQRVVVTGTVNRYLRVIWTIAGTGPSFTFHANFARR